MLKIVLFFFSQWECEVRDQMSKELAGLMYKQSGKFFISEPIQGIFVDVEYIGRHEAV
jgi:hypothetical protein